MTLIPLPFFSSGRRIDADLHLPDAADGAEAVDAAAGPVPVVIACSGYQGQKVIHPERFARALNPLGYAVLAFDYRGFGVSEGERGRLVPQEWAEDIRAGVDRLGGVAEVDSARLALIGWGLGGGVVVAEAAEDPRVKAVACLNGIADGTRSTRNMHDEASWNTLVSRIGADRASRTRDGRSQLADPWDIVRLNLDTRTDGYVGEELYKAPHFGTGVTLESADHLLRFSPEQVADRISPRPLLIVHGAENELHKPVEAQAMYDAAAEPKTLEMLPGKGHTEWMFDDDPTFKQVVVMLKDFLDSALSEETASQQTASQKAATV